MPTPTLCDTAVDNRGFFSDYLAERFPEREDVQQQGRRGRLDYALFRYGGPAADVKYWGRSLDRHLAFTNALLDRIVDRLLCRSSVP